MKEAFRSNSIFYTHKKDVCFENNQRGRKALILPMVSPKKIHYIIYLENFQIRTEYINFSFDLTI